MQDIPEGHPECLCNKTFVITGTQKCLACDEVDDLIKLKRHSSAA